MQARYQQKHQNLGRRERFLCQLFCKYRRVPRAIPRHQQARLPNFRLRVDCRRGTDAFRGLREVIYHAI